MLRRVCAFLATCLAALGLSGCGDIPGLPEIGKLKKEVMKEWSKVEASKEISKLSQSTRGAISALEKAGKQGSRAIEEQALGALNASIKELVTAWKAAMPHFSGDFLVDAKCLLAMAVGGGAIAASGGLALAGLGFGSEGVEAGSLAALWQSSIGDVEAGSLFARLQSLGAKGLSEAQKFTVRGVLADISECFCGVVNSLCHHCISGHMALSTPRSTTSESPLRGGENGTDGPPTVDQQATNISSSVVYVDTDGSMLLGSDTGDNDTWLFGELLL